MPSLWESLFGAATSPPQHPASRGALLGAGYQAMPEMTAGIEDRRQDYPYAALMADTITDPRGQYPRSSIGAGSDLPVGYGFDPMPGLVDKTPTPLGPYQPSFQPSMRPPTRGAPYVAPSMGPRLRESQIGVVDGDSNLFSANYLPLTGLHP